MGRWIVQKLGSIVFGDPAQLAKLDAITHPLIMQTIKERVLQHADEAIVFVDVPLLLESGGYTDWVDEVWVVSASPEQQLERIMARDGLSVGQAQARIAAQWPTAKKAAMADFVIDNSHAVEQTYEQIEQRLKNDY